MAAPPFTVRSESVCHGGRVGFYTHQSAALGLEARFAVFMPPNAAANAPVPVVYVLAGLTCTEETFFIKAHALQEAARLGVALVATDTSPRGAGIEGEDTDWDFGTGAGFYLDATIAPWSSHYRMGRYITQELPALVEAHFALDGTRRGIMGHSMGGMVRWCMGCGRRRFGNLSRLLRLLCTLRLCRGGKRLLPTTLGQTNRRGVLTMPCACCKMDTATPTPFWLTKAWQTSF
ncbi:S-formylglutathione hydrolase [Acetobacter orientalis]|uniref:S-formylglutathione hydrolase n=1 Tax=Acetobacter orientalis TaxID=146474 RepID=A0A2Z5ZCY5_9PROT|nr:S-formylglutathione hydrolase [Acetobacter orientalis]